MKLEFRTVPVPEGVLQAPPLRIEELPDSGDSLASRIESGKAFLRVVAYPWGVEFDVCESQETRP